MTLDCGCGCEQGFHHALVAKEPVDSGESVEVDWVCPACGLVEYTVSWTKAAWIEEIGKQAAREAKAAAGKKKQPVGQHG